MSASERQKRWRDGKNRKGMTRLDIWVPTDRVDGLKALVSDLITYPDMAVVGVKEEPGEGVQGVQPPAAASSGKSAANVISLHRGAPAGVSVSPVGVSDSQLPVSLDELSQFEAMQVKREVVLAVSHCDRSCSRPGGADCVFGEGSGEACIVWQTCQAARAGD